jgi:hypothetical protein
MIGSVDVIMSLRGRCLPYVTLLLWLLTGCMRSNQSSLHRCGDVGWGFLCGMCSPGGCSWDSAHVWV